MIRPIPPALVLAFAMTPCSPSIAAEAAAPPPAPPRRMEALGRGLVAVRRPDGGVYLGWRLLGTDPEGIAFHVDRASGGEAPARLTREPIRATTDFVDGGAKAGQAATYTVRPVVDGVEGGPGAPFTLPADAPARPYLAIPLKTPAGYTPGDAAAADLDGDGEYEIIVKQELRGFDNSQRGVCPGTTKLEAYKLDGTLLWRVDLGPNVREGAHYTPFIAADLDGDGRAEVAVRTAEGTVDGTGATIGDVDGDGRTDHVNRQTGYILEGPEFLSVFDGPTGREVARTPYLPRGRVADWGDSYGNRVDRFLMGVGSFDGVHPGVLMCRGYYTITKIEALDYRDGRLTTAWRFDTAARPEWKAYEGQGNHNLRVGDVDGDGKDEVIYGAMALRHDGTPLYTTGLGHGDAIHLSDFDPDRPGLEIFDIHEHVKHPHGAEFRDAATGRLLWSLPSPDVGRGLAIDLDPRHRGAECWAAGPGLTGLHDVKGARISDARPRSCNFAVWWDADPLRELLDRTTIAKWDPALGRETPLLTADGCGSNNGTKATPALSADLFGDWREEVAFRSLDGHELRIYTTTLPADRRLVTLMHDPIYRNDVAMQNVGYNMPPHTSFYLGDGMSPPPRPRITTASRTGR